MSAPAKQITIREEGPTSLVPAQSESSAIVNMIERAARDPSVDVDKLRQLMEMRTQVEDKQAERDFYAAMNEVQSKLRRIRADAMNPQTRSKYATYAALDRALRPVYTEAGITLDFNTGDAPEGMVRVMCDVSKGGHVKHYKIDMPADGKGAKGNDVMTKTHATGSAVSYGMRYLLKMIFNIAVGEDDDGNAASDTGARVSEEQLAELRTLIVDVGADIAKFCKYFKVEHLEDLAASKFTAAKQALEAKRTK